MRSTNIQPGVASGLRPTRGARRRAMAAAGIAGALAFAAFVPVGPVDANTKTEHVQSANPTVDIEPGSMYSVVDQIGARDLWAEGITGDGVNVAVIDTGVAPVKDLAGADKVVAMVDLSAEAGVPEARYVDTYGHGTHMAGIIAGRTPGADPATASEHPEWFLGVAPDAGIVSVKVADNTGAVDITQVIAGVDWVVDHADELDIGVLNLSYSSGSTLDYRSDPLTFALERAWNAGIVVVVAAGNDGKKARELASPAIDPFVIAVAATVTTKDHKFVIPEWATSGNRDRRPDISAPGASIESLRAPNSRADLEHPEGYVDERIFRGSGSSQAAAVVAGGVALLLDARPELTPDEVKALLVSDTTKVNPVMPDFSGAGLIKLDGLVDAAVPANAVQTHEPARGDGSLALARGLPLPEAGVTLDPTELTIFGTEWVGAQWSGTRWTGAQWTGSHWSAGEWMGAQWSGASWTGAHWAGASWSGASWTGSHWSGAQWSGAQWSGASWTGAQWSGSHWSGAQWSGAQWSGAQWSGSHWSGAQWSGSHWSGGHWG
ncbi:MAG: S8 family serine peptidase [Ilumatobacter sp.]